LKVTRVILVGFMGAGKTSVGERIAAALGWRFVDLDDAIEQEEGRSVPEIFEHFGEARFRAVEARAAAEHLVREDIVIATGGGWAAVEGWRDALPAGTLSVWLDVDPDEAVRRAAQETGRRPLLAGEDPLRAAQALLRRRRAGYASAMERVDTTGRSLDDVTVRVLEVITNYGLKPELNEH